MTIAVDTSFLVDVLRKHGPAVELLRSYVKQDEHLVGSIVVRAEVLSGMRVREEARTRQLLGLIQWEPVMEPESEAAGELGRKHLAGNKGIDTPDLLTAEVALRFSATLVTANLKHFKSLIPGVEALY
jgi:predicted nucleic acid-binding protein